MGLSGLISPHQIVGVESSPKLLVGAVFFFSGISKLVNPDAPWCWNIYLQNWAIFGLMYVNIPYMEPLGNITPISLWPLRMFMIRIRYS